MNNIYYGNTELSKNNVNNLKTIHRRETSNYKSMNV